MPSFKRTNSRIINVIQSERRRKITQTHTNKGYISQIDTNTQVQNPTAKRSIFNFVFVN